MKSVLETKRLPLVFRVRAAGAVELVAQNDVVRGRWDRNGIADLPDAQELLVALMNCSNTANDVLAFTAKYGPLTISPGKKERFSFRIAEWRKTQQSIRTRWDGLALLPGQGVPLIATDHARVKAEPAEEFVVYGGNWTYVASNLFRMLTLELLATPSNRLRRCNRETCRRYFVAEHRGEQYCSEVCSDDATREAKRKWWSESGEPRRLERARRKSQEPNA